MILGPYVRTQISRNSNLNKHVFCAHEKFNPGLLANLLRVCYWNSYLRALAQLTMLVSGFQTDVWNGIITWMWLIFWLVSGTREIEWWWFCGWVLPVNTNQRFGIFRVNRRFLLWNPGLTRKIPSPRWSGGDEWWWLHVHLYQVVALCMKPVLVHVKFIFYPTVFA